MLLSLLLPTLLVVPECSLAYFTVRNCSIMNPNIDHTTARPNDTAFNIEGNQPSIQLSQTSFGHISTNSSMILTVSMAMESP